MSYTSHAPMEILVNSSLWSVNPHCFKFDRQITDLTCFIALLSVDANIVINNVMTVITTKSSINVKPVFFCITQPNVTFLKNVAQIFAMGLV
jgi:hypothetical protein